MVSERPRRSDPDAEAAGVAGLGRVSGRSAPRGSGRVSGSSRSTSVSGGIRVHGSAPIRTEDNHSTSAGRAQDRAPSPRLPEQRPKVVVEELHAVLCRRRCALLADGVVVLPGADGQAGAEGAEAAGRRLCGGAVAAWIRCRRGTALLPGSPPARTRPRGRRRGPRAASAPWPPPGRGRPSSRRRNSSSGWMLGLKKKPVGLAPLLPPVLDGSGGAWTATDVEQHAHSCTAAQVAADLTEPGRRGCPAAPGGRTPQCW